MKIKRIINCDSEASIQATVEAYLNARHIRYIHIPNKVYQFLFYSKHVPVWVKALCSKHLKGIPDLLIFKKEEKYNSCLLLELKAEKGKVSDRQKLWHDGLNVAVVFSWPDARKIIDEFYKK